MEAGAILTENSPGLFYMPDGEIYGMIPSKRKIEKKDGIALDGPYLVRLSRFQSVKCHRCKSCKKLIVPYS